MKFERNFAHLIAAYESRIPQFISQATDFIQWARDPVGWSMFGAGGQGQVYATAGTAAVGSVTLEGPGGTTSPPGGKLWYLDFMSLWHDDTALGLTMSIAIKDSGSGLDTYICNSKDAANPTTYAALFGSQNAVLAERPVVINSQQEVIGRSSANPGAGKTLIIAARIMEVPEGDYFLTP